MFKYISVIFLLYPLCAMSQEKDMVEFEKMLLEVQRSHIEGNAPDKRDFEVYLQRDLDSYFKKQGLNTKVGYELLMEGATQIGMSYPKYYVWVKVYNQGALVKEGALTVAAIEKKHFKVYELLNKSLIRERPESVKRYFPRKTHERIYELAGVK